MRDDRNPLFDYAEALSGPIPSYLLALERDTYLKTLAPQMICGRWQGRLLALISQLLRPKRVLEIGTFTGYSALCLAEGLAPSGQLDTIEGNPEMAYLAQQYFAASPYAAQIKLHPQTAKIILPQLKEQYDLIFLDADKRNYAHYFHSLINQLRPGGLFLSDNVLWDGRVIDPKDEDPDVRALAEFNQLLAEDARMETLLFPLRDGLSLARKKA